MRRWLAGGAVLVVAVAALILALQGSFSHTSRHDVAAPHGASRDLAATGGRTSQTSSTASATTSTSPTLRAPTGPPSPRERRLRSTISRALATIHGAGGNAGLLVFDLTTGRALYATNARVGRAPASVEKVWTTTALMDRVGPDARLHTSILGTGRLRHGVWHGNLYLRGGGDPTFGDTTFNRVWNGGQGADASALVTQLHRHGIRRVTGRVYADASLFDNQRGGLMTDYKPDIPDLGGELGALTYDHGTTNGHDTPGAFTAHEVVLTMRQDHITATAARHARPAPRTAQLLATVASPPMSAMVRLMDVPSDDFFAEMFAKQLGVLFGHGGSISAGAHVISQTIASAYDLHPTILDGSGLDRHDRTSPVQIVDLLRDLSGTPTGREVSAALPTVGVNGTVEGIGVKTAAQGHCIAKTGSLNYVTNLAGYCSARDGQKIAFGLFIDGPDNATGFALEGDMVAAIARY